MPFGMRRHLLRLIALIRSQGTQTKANSEAGKAKSSGRQTEGWCKKSFKAMAEVWRNGPSVRVHSRAVANKVAQTAKNNGDAVPRQGWARRVCTVMMDRKGKKPKWIMSR
ncbi:unnamed protein product [Fusarium graminearum]|uniref:Chromosome 1, complete genome n=1 Tax=Gibberella zeae (strain ATCC MYA-4620 / CBS 123657 / FGSC 9075 / NRRL 31084 / PH-1) TaxID=229533 RepID=I1S5C7_GIBZE|nr:hypothetical protein FGSG_12045 [Fusarium graminearum PH-1]ESU07347.1 hypothetical protein FGSG_12045 [Fusarium graminearum PH-1]EYB34522.1 hypothetical protein FG05_12045 [Fusarium graminearum]CEF74187.1 unnamed protein product [Fusarium graminearum]CZS77454.1 unnamed protein product [Fusarium graminearum]|eukprot:XP_011317832.1 hypothetical protein FGSG_12045 [Fusarium graminearum PH-1]